MPDNPARWSDLKAMGFETPTKLTRGSHPSLPYSLMAVFTADLCARDAVAARALELLILTNVRTDAVLKAAWDEFDLDQALWTVPLSNLKDRTHRREGFRVPLFARAAEIVEQMQSGARLAFRLPRAGARQAPIEHGAVDAPEANELRRREELDRPREWPPDYGTRISGDLQDLGRRGRDLPPCSSRTGDGASGRHPGRTGLPPDGRPRQASQAEGRLGRPLRADGRQHYPVRESMTDGR
jgi:hypothetical protein